MSDHLQWGKGGKRYLRSPGQFGLDDFRRMGVEASPAKRLSLACMMLLGRFISPAQFAAEVELVRRLALADGLILCVHEGEQFDRWSFERPWVGTFGDVVDAETGEIFARAVVRQDGGGYRAECCETGYQFEPIWHEEITYREGEVPPLFNDE